MAYNATNPNGQATSANSAPVVIASDNVVDVASNQVIGTGSITAADTASATASGQSSQALYTGTPTSGSAYALTIPNVNGMPESFSSVVTHISGTFVGTYQFERSPDGGTTWTPFSQFVAGQAQTVATGTLPGMFHGNVAGVTSIRVRCTAYSSGTIAVRFSMGAGSGTITVGNPIRLYDMANNSQATIKPASTAPVATDTAIVTVESPNSPLLTSTLSVKTANDASVSGSLAATNASVTTAQLVGASTATIQVTGTWAGTLTPQASIDGTTYVTLGSTALVNVNSGGYSATIPSGAQSIWQADVAAFNYFRISETTYTSGTATVTIRSSGSSGMVALDAPIPSGSNTIGNVNITGSQAIGINALSSVTGLSIFSNQALSNTVVSVKSSSARMMEYDFYNPNTSGVWVQLFNATVASVTLGTTAPTRTIYIPASAGRDWTSPYSISWATALSIACTSTNTGSGSPGSSIQAYVGYV